MWFHTHEHMRYWVQDLTASWADSDNYVLRKASTKNEVLLDCSVYSKNQNWRLPYNAKLGSDRLLVPVGDGCWRDWLVTDCFDQGRQFITYALGQKVIERTSTTRRPRVTTRVGRPQSDAYQTLADAEWPEPLSTPINTLDVLSLLQAVVPTQKMTRDLYINITMAAKNAGVQYADFMKTHHSRWSDSSGGWQRMTQGRWRGLNNHTGHTLGKPFLTAAAQASGNLSEDLIRAIRFKVAYELDTTGVPSMEINDHYLTGAVDVSTIKERAIVLVSNMGTGKSLLMRELCKTFKDQRIGGISWVYGSPGTATEHGNILRTLQIDVEEPVQNTTPGHHRAVVVASSRRPRPERETIRPAFVR